MRLVDADALRKTMYHEAFETDSDMQKWDGGCWIRYKMFENAIESAPTITPDMAQVLAYESGKAERKRGEWIDLGKDRTIRWQCSECGRKDTHIYNYCPDCGADMRGREK